MKVEELKHHPLVASINQVVDALTPDDAVCFHLLLPPEYNIPDDKIDPLKYIFVEKKALPKHLFSITDQNVELEASDGNLVPKSGFSHCQEITILQTTSISNRKQLNLLMHELYSNPYEPSPVPPLCSDIQYAYEHPDISIQFLNSMVRSNSLPGQIQGLIEASRLFNLKKDEIDTILCLMHAYMDQLCNTVFEVKPFQIIPTIFKIRTNYIIFSAVANLFHKRLLKRLHKELSQENKIAEKSIKKRHACKASPEGLIEAASILGEIVNVEYPLKGIGIIRNFFNAVLNALNNDKAPADDIMPALCAAISITKPISAVIVSIFTYYLYIWPDKGLDEKTGYIVSSCAIAASNIGCFTPG